jgi:hypothetical protein
MKRLIFSTFFTILAISPSISKADEGQGYACFQTEAQAKSALDKTGMLKESYRPLIKTIWTLDYIESSGNPFIPTLKDESAEGYLTRVVKNFIAPLSPGFAKTLLGSIKENGRQKWEVRSDLEPKSNEIEISHYPQDNGAHKKCVIVQLLENGSTVSYDKELFTKLTSNSVKLRDMFIGDTTDITTVTDATRDFNEGVQGQALLILNQALQSMDDGKGQLRKLAQLLLKSQTYKSANKNFIFLMLLQDTGFFRAENFGINPQSDRWVAFKEAADILIASAEQPLINLGYTCNNDRLDWRESVCAHLEADHTMSTLFDWTANSGLVNMLSKGDVESFALYTLTKRYYNGNVERLLIADLNDQTEIKVLCKEIDQQLKMLTKEAKMYPTNPYRNSESDLKLFMTQKARNYCKTSGYIIEEVKKPVSKLLKIFGMEEMPLE